MFGGGAASPERGYWVGGMRVSVFGLYFGLQKRPAGFFGGDKIVFWATNASRRGLFGGSNCVLG